jgi:hypothetical protein
VQAVADLQDPAATSSPQIRSPWRGVLIPHGQRGQEAMDPSQPQPNPVAMHLLRADARVVGGGQWARRRADVEVSLFVI